MKIPALQEWLATPRPALVQAVADGLRAHVAALRSRGIEFYGYALLPGETYDIRSLVAATNTTSAIKVAPDHPHYRYHRYSVDEWSHYDHDGFAAANALLVAANHQFASLHTKPAGDCMMDDYELAHSQALLDAILQGMVAAKAAGAFGRSEPFLVIWISGSSEPITAESVRRLNPPAVAEEFVREFGG